MITIRHSIRPAIRSLCFTALIIGLSACSTFHSQGLTMASRLCHQMEGDIAKHISACDTAIQSHQFDGHKLAELYVMKGIHLQTAGKYSEAVVSFNMAVGLNPRDVTGYYYRGMSLLKLGKYTAAEHDINLASNLN